MEIRASTPSAFFFQPDILTLAKAAKTKKMLKRSEQSQNVYEKNE